MNTKYRSRMAATALALFGGMFGLHRFFLGQWWGIIYLIFFWTYIPAIVAYIEAIIFIRTDQEKWNQKYNDGKSVGEESGTVVVICAFLFPLLMIVGVFGAIAIPAYQDYTIRAKVGEGLNYGHKAKLLVSEYYIDNNEIPASLSDVNFNEVAPENVKDIIIDPQNGTIIITFSGLQIDNRSVAFEPYLDEQQNIQWICKTLDMDHKYIPAACRN